VKLEGLKVIDLSLFLPGPLMTQMMADHGAEVIKVEPVHGGEPNRTIGAARDGTTVYFANTHRGKKSLQVNLKAEQGRSVLLDLAATSDVFVEAFRPGVVDRLGVGYEQVKARNPRIVYCSISAFGQDGPYVKKPAHDLAAQAQAGMLSVNLSDDGQPAIPAIASGDMLSSMMALSGVLMALLRCRQTGQGDYLDIAMMDSLIAAMPNNLGPVFADKQAPVAKNERSWGGNAMYNLYATKDGGHIALGGAEIHFARNVLEKMGRPDLIALCEPPPGANQEPVRAFLRETFATKTRAEWVEWFEGVDAAFAPVNDLREGADDPQVRARGMIFEDERGWEHIGVPMKFAAEPGKPHLTFPRMGEHGEAILRELGYSEDAIAQLTGEGIVTGT